VGDRILERLGVAAGALTPSRIGAADAPPAPQPAGTAEVGA
jgi:hypothetical protein